VSQDLPPKVPPVLPDTDTSAALYLLLSPCLDPALPSHVYFCENEYFILVDGSHIRLDVLHPDPRVRDSFWTAIINGQPHLILQLGSIREESIVERASRDLKNLKASAGLVLASPLHQSLHMLSPSDVSNHLAKVDGWERSVQLAMEKLLEERNHRQMYIDALLQQNADLLSEIDPLRHQLEAMSLSSPSTTTSSTIDPQQTTMIDDCFTSGLLPSPSSRFSELPSSSSQSSFSHNSSQSSSSHVAYSAISSTRGVSECASEIDKWLEKRRWRKPSSGGYDIDAAFIAASCSNIDALRWLHVNGVDLKQKNTRGRMLIFDAAHSGRLSVLQFLHSVGVDLTQVDDKGRLITLDAASGGNLEVLQWLREEVGVSMDAQSFDGWTPAHRASEKGQTHVLDWLLATGANFKLKGRKGKTIAQSGGANVYSVAWFDRHPQLRS